MKLSGVSILQNRRENFKLNALFVVVLVPESKALYLQGMRCIVYDIIIVRPHNYDKPAFSNNSTRGPFSHWWPKKSFTCGRGPTLFLSQVRKKRVRTRKKIIPNKLNRQTLKKLFFPRIHFSVMFSSHLFPFKFHPRKSLFHATCQDCIAEIQHLLELGTIGQIPMHNTGQKLDHFNAVNGVPRAHFKLFSESKN